MKKFKTNQIILIISIVMTVTSSNSQELNNALPKIENHLEGDLDYTNEALELVQKQVNGEEISLGKINTDGTIQFNLPEFDSIPSIGNKFQSWFSIDSNCKDRDVFAETPFDDVSSYKYDPIYIKKYGMNLAALYPVSDEIIVSRNNNQRAILPAEAKYFWFYIDRDITYKDDCIKISNRTGNAYASISANIKFEKGWNFIEENLVDIQEVVQDDSQTIMVRTTEFKRSSPTSKKVKWFIQQFTKDEEIQFVKKLYNLTPITKEQFEKWAPNKLGDLSITTKEHGNPPKRMQNKNNIHLTYADKVQKKEIDLYVIDAAKNPDDMEMINFAYAMENDGKDEKDIKPYIAQFSERDKAISFMYKVEDRMFVTASGKNMSTEELWEYIKKLNIKKLLKK